VIRRYRPEDCDQVLDVWAAASAQAHPFLGESFLERERNEIRTVHLPRAETWVWEAGGRVAGFLSLLGNEVGAVFVDPDCQRSGIGQALMDHARARRGALEVEVFRDNAIGRAFYGKYGFRPASEGIHEPTGRRVVRLRLDERASYADGIRIAHLFEHPEHVDTVAHWIYEEWWKDRPGHTVETMAARLREAKDRNGVPLSLVALQAGEPVGTVNLVDNDNEERPDLKPWLAALLVRPEHRGCGVGSALVRSLAAEAGRLGIPRMYLGTDIPGYYARLGAELFEKVSDEYSILCIRTRGGSSFTT
jgi:putative acetyltransferase